VQRYLAARGRSKVLMPLEYTVQTPPPPPPPPLSLLSLPHQVNGRTFMLPVSDFDCLESAGAHARAYPVPMLSVT